MSKKKRKVVDLIVGPGGVLVEDQPTPLAKSIVLGATLLEENERLEAENAALRACAEDLQRQVDRADRKPTVDSITAQQLAYWKARRRRFLGVKHLSVGVEVFPWSWRWGKPLVTRSMAGEMVYNRCFNWLFLRVELVDE